MKHLTAVGTQLSFERVPANAYIASAISDFLRRRLIEGQVSFTFETVMSSPDKIAFLKFAQASGYRTYLYYIATENPDINLSRVMLRVRSGGHDVPKDKIVSRYHRSLELLMDAIRATHRAYIFDNSGDEPFWIAEITNGQTLEIKRPEMPAWFKTAVLDKI